MNLHHINTIARYEVKLLRRGWLFRIFAVLILFFLTVYQLQLFTNIFWKYNEVWSHVGVSSLIPYITHYLYVVAQSGIVIFLAGNFIKRDKKLDTAEVIYVRPMSNFDYIVGKVWGIVRTFLGLNVLVLLVAMFINVVLSRSPFNPVFYLTYLLTISLPSLLFILGLSFAAMSLFRNQAVTFIVMLGLMAIVFFFLKDRLYGIFDFFGSDIPSVFSDVTGHANLRLYLWQRSVYLLLAIGLLLLTISFLHRLPLRPWKGKLLGGIALLFIVWGFATGWGYVHSFQNRIDKREEYRAIYNRHAGLSQTRVLTNDLIIKQSGNNLDVVSRLTLKNENRIQAIQPVILYLNPELKIMSIMNEGCNVPFVREKQVIRIDSLPLHSGDLTLSLYYSGTLDEDICYLDLEDNEYFKKSELSDFYYGKKYLYLQREFTLLTPECLWYPVSEPPVYPAIPYAVGKNFTRYTLKYINSRNKTVISQGHCELVADTVKYSNKTPLPGISLTVGDYEKKAIRVDSTDYELYTFKDHDFFSQSFDQIGDTLPALIRATRNEIEATKNREYLFSKFAMVETPIHFTGYVRNWKGYSEQVMPEIVFLPERGVNTMADFKANYLRVRDWRRQESVMEDNEIQAQMLRDYIRITFIDEESSEGAAPWSHTPQLNKWNIGAMFFGHVGFLTSVEYPIADVVLNTMQNVKESTVKPIWWGMTNALDDKSRANIYLDGHSFKDAVEDRSMKSQVFYELLKLKSFYLRNYITTKITEDQLKTFLKTFSEKSTFEEVSFTTWLVAFEKEFGIDLTDFMERWYTLDYTPFIQLADIDANVVVKDDFTRYQVKFKAYNSSDVDAIISVRTEASERGRRMHFSPGGGAQGAEIKFTHYVIPAQTAMEIKLITEDMPGKLIINTNISRNLPNEYTYTFVGIDHEISDTITGSFTIDTMFFSPDPHEIIIDNEDVGFSAISGNQKQKLQQLLKKKGEDKYKAFTFWQLPSMWTFILNSKCYGEQIASAVYKVRGEGKSVARWCAEIRQENYYELSVWNPKLESWNVRGRRGSVKSANTHTYTIKYGDQEEKLSVDMNEGETGWISLGSFYLPEGEVVVSLGDNVSGAYVIADAVKWTMSRKR